MRAAISNDYKQECSVYYYINSWSIDIQLEHSSGEKTPMFAIFCEASSNSGALKGIQPIADSIKSCERRTVSGSGSQRSPKSVSLKGI